MKIKIILLLVITMVLGLFLTRGDSAEELQTVSNSSVDTTQHDDIIPEVRVRDLKAQVMNDKIEVTGRTQASKKIQLKSETDGRVLSVFVEKGDNVEKGQILAKLEMRDRGARVVEAEQLVKQREIQYRASKELAEKGFNSRVRLAEKEAQLESAKAQLKQARIELSNVNIRAPFDGIVNDKMVETGDYLSRGDVLFDIVDLSPIEIVGFLTEKQIDYVREGDVATATLLKGQKVTGVVNFISAAADSQTRTFEVEMVVPNADNLIKDGLTAKLHIPVKEEEAYKVSPSVLSLSNTGAVGVKVVNANQKVEFLPIQLLKDTPEYLWIGGLPSAVRLITVGQEFVVPGQKVKPVMVEGQSLL